MAGVRAPVRYGFQRCSVMPPWVRTADKSTHVRLHRLFSRIGWYATRTLRPARSGTGNKEYKTIRIAHVNVSRGFRGGERQAQLLIDELANTGVEQVLVARRGESLAQRMRDRVEIREVSGSPFSVFGATNDVDIIQVHEGRSVYGAWLRSMASGTPYVLTRRVNNPIKSNWLARAVYRRAGYVVSVATEIANIVQRYDEQIRSTVIHSASSGFVVDPATSDAIRSQYADRFVVGHVGALDNQQKGQEYIIEVARELQNSNPDIVFVLVGGGADEAMLKAAAADCNNINFTGFVDNVGDYLAAFDVFILPSNKEGIGGILLDAMDRELPVVAARVGGVPEIVRDGETGILIDPARTDQLKTAILSLQASAELRRTLGANGRAFARNFTPAVMAGKYLSLYESLVS